MELLDNYPAILTWIPLSIVGFWTHQIYIWMGESEERQEIIGKVSDDQERAGGLLDESNENLQALAKDTGHWLYLWVWGAGFIITARYMIVWMFVK